jgi:hypothetical protein
LPQICSFFKQKASIQYSEFTRSHLKKIVVTPECFNRESRILDARLKSAGMTRVFWQATVFEIGSRILTRGYEKPETQENVSYIS